MRKNIVAGNWKMNKTLQEGINLAKEINDFVTHNPTDIRIIIASPFIHLSSIVKIVENSEIYISAQNCHSEEKGAFTGEISAEMIKSTGASYVIIGHSERREYFKEEDFTLGKKVKVSLKNELFPIFCCGEKLGEREKGFQFSIVKQQLENGLFDLN
jgi:triosephosphate isomerase (TIM)